MHRALLLLILTMLAPLAQAAETVYPPAPVAQSAAAAEQKSTGCTSCHDKTDAPTMHPFPGVNLGCADCHGGDASVIRPTAAKPGLVMVTVLHLFLSLVYPSLLPWLQTCSK